MADQSSDLPAARPCVGQAVALRRACLAAAILAAELGLGGGPAEAYLCTLIKDEVTSTNRVCVYECGGDQKIEEIERNERCQSQIDVADGPAGAFEAAPGPEAPAQIPRSGVLNDGSGRLN